MDRFAIGVVEASARCRDCASAKMKLQLRRWRRWGMRYVLAGTEWSRFVVRLVMKPGRAVINGSCHWPVQSTYIPQYLYSVNCHDKAMHRSFLLWVSNVYYSSAWAEHLFWTVIEATYFLLTEAL